MDGLDEAIIKPEEVSLELLTPVRVSLNSSVRCLETMVGLWVVWRKHLETTEVQGMVQTELLEAKGVQE